MDNIDDNLSFLEEPGNKDNCEQLRNLLFEGRMVAFVGAGCSVPLGYPTWSGLIRKMIDQCVRQQPGYAHYWHGLAGQLGNINLLTLAEQCKKILDTYYFELLEREFDRNLNPNYTSEHKCLIKLPFHRFITSNYDECIEAAFIRVRVDTPKSFSYDDVRRAKFVQCSDETRNFIFHCHGKHHPSRDIILTESDYKIHYFRRPEYTQMLIALFQSSPVLFIGFSLSDADFGQIPRQLSALFENRAQEHFALLPIPISDLKEFTREDLHNRFNIHAIFYPVGENNDHSARERILKKLLYEQQVVR